MERPPLTPGILGEMRRRAQGAKPPRFVDPEQCARIAHLWDTDHAWCITVLGRTPAPALATRRGLTRRPLPALEPWEMELLDLASGLTNTTLEGTP